jgi:hypothetical protein
VCSLIRDGTTTLASRSCRRRGGAAPIDGRVTIHGKVATAADRTRADKTVRNVDGVKSVKNLLPVVPEKAVMRTIVADADVKDRVEASCPFQIP